MKMIQINSGEVEMVGYDNLVRLLRIKLRESSMIYDFLNVPHEVFQDLLKSESKSQFLDYNIKPYYDSNEVRPRL